MQKANSPFLFLLLLLTNRVLAADIASGEHWRLTTERGPVHVFRPAGFSEETAGVVLYVHGYFTDVDAAWSEHDLAAQFARSGANAWFIVPEAPANRHEAIPWPVLGDLLDTVFAAVGSERPAGALIAVGHSGAYRTIARWLDHPALREIVLLDAFYGCDREYASWLVGSVERRLVLVAVLTAPRSESFSRRFRFAVNRNGLPAGLSGFAALEQGARLLHLRARATHLGLVTDGKVIPLLLQLIASSQQTGRRV